MNCTICNRPIILIPSAAERAKKFGGKPSDYTALFREHSECIINKRNAEARELLTRQRGSAHTSLLGKMALTAAVTLAFTYQALKPVPEVWLGDRTNACIVIVQPDGTQTPCPEDKSELPDHYIPVYVIEETQP